MEEEAQEGTQESALEVSLILYLLCSISQGSQFLSQLLHFNPHTWKNNREWPRSLGPCTYLDDSEEQAPGFWFWNGSDPGIEAIWGVN